MKQILIAVLAVAACGKTPVPPKLDPPGYYRDNLPPAEDLRDLMPMFLGMKQRMIANFLENGQVVSRDGGETADLPARAQGDSKLFSGIALGVLDCDEGRPVLDAILSSIQGRSGAIVRFEPLPQEYTDASNETSLDMVVGVMFGLTERARKCPEDLPAIRDAWALHRAFVASHGGRMAEHVRDYGLAYAPGFKWSWDLTGYLLGTNGKPGGQEAAELVLLADIRYVVVKKKACYPIHLGMLQVIEAARNDEAMSKLARWTMCEEIRNLGIPMADWLCERSSARYYLDNFHANTWQYQHQRCAAWESPDGDNEGQPGLDALVLYSIAQ